MRAHTRYLLLAVASLAVGAAAGCSVPKGDFQPSIADANPMDDPLAIVVSPNTVNVDEGKTADFMVSLNHAPAGPITIKIATTSTKISLSLPELSFNETNFAQPQPITVTGLDDPDALDEKALVVTLSAVGVTDTNVQVNVKDKDTQAIVTDITGTEVSMLEGTTLNVKVHLSAMPTGGVTVNAGIDPGSSMAIVTSQPTSTSFDSSNFGVDVVFLITAAIDNNAITDDVTLTFSATGDGAGGLANKSYTIHVNDKDSLNINAAPTALTINEQGSGNSGVISVTLTKQPPVGANVTLSVTTDPGVNGVSIDPTSLVFTSANYNVAQPVTVTGKPDAGLQDITDHVHFTGTAGPSVSPVQVTVTVANTDVQSIKASVQSLTLAETGSTTFEVWLAQKPSSQVNLSVAAIPDATVASATPGTLSFDASNYQTHQIVTVKGTHDSNLVPNSTTIRVTNGSDLTTNVPTTVTDVDVQAIVLTPAGSLFTIDETKTATFTAALAFDPGGAVTLNVASDDTSSVTVAPLTVSFNSTNYNQPKPITIKAIDDPDAISEDVTITVSNPTLPSQTEQVHVNDKDKLGLFLDQFPNIPVNENGSVDVFASLTAMPQGNVTITPKIPPGTALSVSPASFQFTQQNYNTPFKFRFTAADDANSVDENINVTWQSSSPDVADVTTTVNVKDDDVLNIKITPTGSTSIIEQGTPGNLAVSLTAAPPSTTTVTITSSKPAAVLLDPGTGQTSSTTLTFNTSNFGTVQNVALIGVSDLDTVDTSSIITLSASGFAPQTLTVNVQDDDVQKIVTDAQPSYTMLEDGTATFNVSLAFQPSAPVTVSLASANTDIATVTPAQIIFDATNYGMPKPVTIKGTHDANLANNSTTISITGVNTVNVTANVTDVDKQVINFTKASITLDEGKSDTFGVSLAKDPGGTVTVAVSSDNAAVTVLPATALVFNSSNYTTAQTITLNAVVDPNTIFETVHVTGSGATAPANASLTVAVQDKTQVLPEGYNGVLTSVTLLKDGLVTWFPLNVPVNSSLDSLSMRATIAQGTYQIALYTDAGGTPGSLVAGTTTAQPVVMGDNTYDLNPDVSVPQGNYWIAIRGFGTAASTNGLHIYKAAPGEPTAKRCSGDTTSSPAAAWALSATVGMPYGNVVCFTNSGDDISVFNLWITTYHQNP